MSVREVSIPFLNALFPFFLDFYIATPCRDQHTVGESYDFKYLADEMCLPQLIIDGLYSPVKRHLSTGSIPRRRELNTCVKSSVTLWMTVPNALVSLRFSEGPVCKLSKNGV